MKKLLDRSKPGGLTESETQDIFRLEAAKLDCFLWRNNIGAFKTEAGRWVRYGLANDSTRANKELKSSDLIGLYRGRFVAVEAKPENWVFSGEKKEIAQLRFILLVKKQGGLAGFCASIADLYAILEVPYAP